MVRVVYLWRVRLQDFAEFQDTWRDTTLSIHDSVEGAKGSFMLRSVDAQDEVLTIAKWDSLEAWQTFWGNQNPQQMQKMKTLGERISVEVFEEIEDHTR